MAGYCHSTFMSMYINIISVYKWLAHDDKSPLHIILIKLIGIGTKGKTRSKRINTILWFGLQIVYIKDDCQKLQSNHFHFVHSTLFWVGVLANVSRSVCSPAIRRLSPMKFCAYVDACMCQCANFADCAPHYHTHFSSAMMNNKWSNIPKTHFMLQALLSVCAKRLARNWCLCCI